MTTTAITVPQEKAEHLKIIAGATQETLRILASKVKGKSPMELAAMEKKLKSYEAFI